MNPNLERTLKNLALPVYKLSIDGAEELKVNQISLVDTPAISEDFIYFADNKDKAPLPFQFKTQSQEKRIVYGPAMIPDLPIYRSPDEANPAGYYVYYDGATTEKIAHKFLTDNLTSAFNLNHSKEKNNAGAVLVESFITKSRFVDLGFDLPKGTWMVGVKITDENIWNDYVKTGQVKGFSVEILAEHIPVQFNNNYTSKLQQIKDLLKNEGFL